MTEWTRYYLVNERTDGSGGTIAMIRTNQITTRFQRWQRTPGRWVDSPWDSKYVRPFGEVDPHFEEIGSDEAEALMLDNPFDELPDERIEIMRARWEADQAKRA